MTDESILLSRKTGKPTILKSDNDFVWDKSKYPTHKLFKCDSYTHHPHPYMITPYHLENNPHHMYIGKEQIEQMESDIHHSLCGFGRTASGKYEKKGQTACNLLFDEHKRVMAISVDSSYIKSNPDGTDKLELREYIKSINDIVSKDGFVGYVFMEEEE